ncbi:MAG TPA: hypothetical protein VNJ08_01080 [Bacteriovoracaceae bacterium]|nr:hypothetical protein [Bacteriovoracaceae bacterium]
MKLISLFAMILASTSVLADAQDAAQFGNFDYKFNALPLEGKLAGGTKAWSGEYWAFKLGNINLRWNSPNPIGYNLPSPGRAAVMNMSEAQLATLAPSEKWSIFQGDYDYAFVAEVGSYTGKLKKLWAGICHGWAPASLNHEEPTPKVLISKDGVRVPFGSGDIKGILSYFYADQQESAAQVGKKCSIGGFFGGGCGGDVNPAALHVIMANMLGIKHEGFLMDRDAGKEVWNQPVSGFSSKQVSGIRRTGNGFEVDMQTSLTYTDESKPTWEVVYGTENQKNAVMELAYTLELDKNMNIVDGKWNSGTSFPDFLWITPKLTEYKGDWTGLDQLLND